VAAIFGVRQPEALSLLQHDEDDDDDDPAPSGLSTTATEKSVEEAIVTITADDDGSWPVQAGEHYDVYYYYYEDSAEERNGSSAGGDSSGNATIPKKKVDVMMGDLYDLLGCEDHVQSLSHASYNRIWNDKDTPPDFRRQFVSITSTYKFQAHLQFAWFCEVWGGPTMGGLVHRDAVLLPHMLARHTKSKMVFVHACTWLSVMNGAVKQEFGERRDYNQIDELLGLYWLHLYSYFPYDDDQRIEFRRIVMEA